MNANVLIIYSALVLAIMYGMFLSTILISRITKSGYYVIEKWVNRPLSIIIFTIVTLYTLFYYKFLFDAIKTGVYELMGIYSTIFLPPILIIMIILILTQYKQFKKFSR